MTKVYIAGPMSHYAGHNFEVFHDAAHELRMHGFEVMNPVDINPDASTPWAACLKQDLPRLLDCDAVAVLPGWDLSKGALLEVHVAQAVNIPTLPLQVFLDGRFAGGKA